MQGSQREKVLGELGVLWITYGLTCAGWHVYRKLNEKGFDLLAEREGKTKWIEIKTRDVLLSRSKNSKYVSVGQSERQRALADYLAVYVHGAGTALLIPAVLPAVTKSVSRNGLKVGEWHGSSFVPVEEFACYIDNYDLK